jgi:hypothetical protein
MGESQHPDPGSGMNNPDHSFLSLETIFLLFLGVKILKFFDEDPGSGMEKSQIRDKHPGSATLFIGVCLIAYLEFTQAVHSLKLPHNLTSFLKRVI